jgi:uncharacterized membrane protein
VKPIKWFSIISLYTALTLLCVYFIPNNSSLIAFKEVLGFTFVAIAPGYCLISFLFPEGKLDFAEKAVLSVALSFSIAGISGLFLGISSIGINFTSITESLSLTVIVLALLSYLRKMGISKLFQNKSKMLTKNR